MPKNPYKLISPQAGRHSEVCDEFIHEFTWKWTALIE